MTRNSLNSKLLSRQRASVLHGGMRSLAETNSDRFGFSDQRKCSDKRHAMSGFAA
ncbi:MAG: hypothetical protein WCK86_08565 [Planctomycetia bacterium]